MNNLFNATQGPSPALRGSPNRRLLYDPGRVPGVLLISCVKMGQCGARQGRAGGKAGLVDTRGRLTRASASPRHSHTHLGQARRPWPSSSYTGCSSASSFFFRTPSTKKKSMPMRVCPRGVSTLLPTTWFVELGTVSEKKGTFSGNVTGAFFSP